MTPIYLYPQSKLCYRMKSARWCFFKSFVLSEIYSDNFQKMQKVSFILYHFCLKYVCTVLNCLKWVSSAIFNRSVQSQFGMECLKWVCNILSDSLLNKVGLYCLKCACAVSSGYMQIKTGLSKVGLSSSKWVCSVQGESVLSKVGLSCPKWVCSVKGGSVWS